MRNSWTENYLFCNLLSSNRSWKQTLHLKLATGNQIKIYKEYFLKAKFLCHEIISYLMGLSLEAQRPHTVGEWAEVNSGGAWVLPLIYHSWITHPRCVLIHSHTHATHHSPHYYVSMANHNFDNSAAAVNYIIDNAS